MSHNFVSIRPQFSINSLGRHLLLELKSGCYMLYTVYCYLCTM